MAWPPNLVPKYKRVAFRSTELASNTTLITLLLSIRCIESSHVIASGCLSGKFVMRLAGKETRQVWLNSAKSCVIRETERPRYRCWQRSWRAAMTMGALHTELVVLVNEDLLYACEKFMYFLLQSLPFFRWSSICLWSRVLDWWGRIFK